MKNDVAAAKAKLGMPLRSGRTGLANIGERVRSPLIGPRAFTGIPYVCATRNSTLSRDALSTMVHFALARIRVRVIPNSAHTRTIPAALNANNILTRILYNNYFVTK